MFARCQWGRKTTTINLFLNFIDPTGGTAKVNNIDVSEEPLETKRYLAYIPEQVMLYPNLTGLENIEYFARLGGHDDMAKTTSVDFSPGADCRLKRQAGASEPIPRGCGKKSVWPLRLPNRPRPLLLDEPTSGLDPKASNEFSELLKQLQEDGAAILMATHDLFRAKETGTRIGIMREGILMQELTTDEVSHADIERIYLEHMH